MNLYGYVGRFLLLSCISKAIKNFCLNGGNINLIGWQPIGWQQYNKDWIFKDIQSLFMYRRSDENMEKSIKPVSRLMEMASPYRGKYIMSIMFAVLGVAAGMIPFFVVSKIVMLLMEGEKDTEIYMKWCMLAGLGFLLKVLLTNLSTMISHSATFETLEGIRLGLVDKLVRVPMGYLVNTPSGQLKNVLVDRVEGMENTLAHLVPELTSNLCVPILILIYLFSLDWRMALVSLITLPVGFLCYGGMAQGYDEKFEGLMQRMRKMGITVIEYINGIEVIKAFNQSENSYKKYSDAVEDNAQYAVDWMRKCQWFKSMLFTVWPSVLVSVLPIGCVLFKSGSLSVSAFVTCIVLALGIINPILAAMNFTDSIAQLKTVVVEITGVLDEKELSRPKEEVYIKSSDIKLEHIYFSYELEQKTEDSLLQDVSLEIPAHSITAFVGPSGSGKSTITKLIAGFWDVTKGAVKIGGIDIREIPNTQLMDQIAYISQDNYLFDETVRENIRIGKPAAEDQDIEEAARKCGCHDFIMNLEHGYDTVVGGSGGHLSGGERQRIAITRALLKDAPIVILDEAMAYIDAENEALIQEAMAKVISGKTVLMIAHRLSTIIDADKIVVVKQGHIEAEGTHQELLVKCLLYQNMWQAHRVTRDEVQGGMIYD